MLTITHKRDKKQLVYTERGIRYMRKGRFAITCELVYTEPHVAMAAMTHVLVLQAQTLGWMNAIEYFGLHPDFDPIPDGQETPYYDFEISKVGDKPITSHNVKIRKRNNAYPI